jgi:dimethylargininase
MFLAFTRSVPASIQHCELTHLAREPIDYARAVAEHDEYEAALARLGCRVQRLPDAPELPDSVFVEDTAVVFDALAVIARPGAASRRPEVDVMAAALAPYRRLAFIEPPGTLDGGDVLVAPGRMFVGVSGRTNADGARQFAIHAAPLGYETIAVPVTGCLHLKSAVTLAFLPPDQPPPRLRRSAEALRARAEAGSYRETRESSLAPSGAARRSSPLLLINPDWVDVKYFDGFDLIEVDPSEPAAANVLRIGDHLICAAEHPRTRKRLDARGLQTVTVPAGELAKAEGGVTCCSVLLSLA